MSMLSSYLIGGTSLLIQCAEILQQQAYMILGVISPDTAVADWATQHNIPHLHPSSDWVTQLQQTPFDYLFSIVNATIIPEAVLTLPRQMAINYHDAPLPRYAGMYATSWALINGAREHGITWHEMTAVVDAGDILQQTAVPITSDDTALTLNAKCYDAAIQAFAELAAQLAAGTAVRQPQDLSQRTYFGLYKRPFPLLNFHQPAAQIHNLVRGLSFGSFANPLTLPKVLAADSVWVVGKTEMLDTLSIESPGTITAVTPTHLHVATATYDIALSQLTTLDGLPARLTPFNVGEQLPLFAETSRAAITQQHEQRARHESFWQRRLANFESPQLPSDLDLFDGKTLTAVHIATLARITGQTEFTLGWHVPDVDGRFFATTVPLHIKISDNDTIEQIETTLQQVLQAIQKRQTYPLDLCLRYPDLAQPSFALVFEEVGDWRLAVFSDQSLIHHLHRAVTTDLTLSLRDMPLLSEAQEWEILVEWNETQVEYAREQTVQNLWLAQVAQRPSAIAAVCGDDQLTYAQLHEKATQLAHRLQVAGVKPGVTVGVYLPRGLDVLVALWGIWLAGGVYVPLDPEYPAGRLEYMMVDAATAVLLTHTALLSQLPATTAQIITLDSLPNPPLERSREQNWGEGVATAYIIYTSGSTGQPKGVMISHAAIAAHIFSIQHVYQITPADRVLQFASFSFDTSIEQILTALLHGATLVMRGDEVWGADEAAQKLATWGVTIANFPTAYWHILASQWANRQLPPHQLRLLIVGGEAMQPTAAQQWAQPPLQDIRLLNAYGPTETTVTAMVFEVGRRGVGGFAPVPIGRPLPNRTAVILDKYGRPSPIGIPGELYLGGIGLAQGYRNQPQLTAERFMPLPLIGNPLADYDAPAMVYRTGDLAYYLPDGTIVFAGRVDEQVKVRGYRIELGEIEAAIRRVAGVQDTAVLLHTTTTNDKQLIADKLLVAYVVGNITETQLRSTLSTQLPHYMLPAAIVFLEALPFTPNGKINRRALPVPQITTAGEFTPPRDAVEEEVASLWTAVLNINPIGRDDNFFQLGGDSLKATRLAAHLSRAFRLDVPLRSLFAAPTVAQLAADLVAREGQPGQIATIARLRQQINQMSLEEIKRQLENKQRSL